MLIKPLFLFNTLDMRIFQSYFYVPILILWALIINKLNERVGKITIDRLRSFNLIG